MGWKCSTGTRPFRIGDAARTRKDQGLTSIVSLLAVPSLYPVSDIKKKMAIRPMHGNPIPQICLASVSPCVLYIEYEYERAW